MSHSQSAGLGDSMASTAAPGIWMFTCISAAMVVVVLDIGLFAPSTTGKALEHVSP